MRTILANFRRLLHAVLVEPRAEVDLADIPGHLERQREKAVFATIFFFVFLTFYQTVGRPEMPRFVTAFNVIMFLFTLSGLILILLGRFRLGLKIAVYGNMGVIMILQILVIARTPDMRPIIINVFFIGLFTLYGIIVAGLCLGRRHVAFIGAAGVLFTALTAAVVRRKMFIDLLMIPMAYMLAATILFIHFSRLFDGVVAKLMQLTTHLQDEVQARTADLAVKETAMRHAGNAIVVTDAVGTIQWVNDAFVRLTGYSAEEAIGSNVRILKSDRHDRVFYQGLWQTILAGDTWRGTITNRRKDGSLYDEELTIAPVFDSHRTITHFISIKEDISEKKRIQSELQESKDRAEEANRAKSVFLGNVSHDLRTPLNSVMGFSEILLARTEDPKARHLLEMIRASGKDLLHLINDLLDVTRIEAGMLTLSPQPTLLREVVATAERGILFEAARKGVNLSVVVDPAVPACVRLDASRLRQIMDNLLGNAVKYTVRGSVRMTVTRHLAPDHESWIEIAVEDSGPGMEPAEQERIFEMFYRANPSSGSGLGIGLALVRQLLQHMGGRIEVQSKVGEGSVFRVMLPAPEAEATAPTTSGRPVAVPRLSGRCLIVDDVEENLRVMTEALRQTGLELLEATDGKTALALAFEMQPNIILLDIRLPDMDGFEVLRVLRADDRTRAIPVVAVTASSTLDEARKANLAGCDAFLPKPIELSSLYREVERLLDGKQPDLALPDGADLAAEIAKLTAELRGDLQHRYREAVETGGLKQAEELGASLRVAGESAGSMILSALGRRLERAADECRVAEIAAVMDRVGEVLG